jgi:hypothetical protein
MGKPHAWKQGLDMAHIRHLVAGCRKQFGPYTKTGEGLPTDKDIARAIKTGKILYDADSLLIFEQFQEPQDIIDFRGQPLRVPAACLIITDLMGPNSEDLLKRIMIKLGAMPADKRPALYVRAWMQDRQQKQVLKAAGLVHLSTSVMGSSHAMIGTFGPKTAIALDHAEEDLLNSKHVQDDIVNQRQINAILKAQAKQSARPPKAIKDTMEQIPGKHTSALGFTVKAGETSVLGKNFQARKTIAKGQIVLFMIPIVMGQDSMTWIHGTSITGEPTRQDMKLGALYYIDPRKPWQITNHSNNDIQILVITTQGDQDVADLLNQ